MSTKNNLRIYVDANRDLDNNHRLLIATYKCLGIFLRIVIWLQQSEGASLARFPRYAKRALPRAPPRGAFF